jgi:hypothetical protein
MIVFKQRCIHRLDGLGGHYSRNLKAIKREKLTRPRDIALQLAHRDAVIEFATNWLKSAVELSKARRDSVEVDRVLEEVLKKIEGDELG